MSNDNWETPPDLFEILSGMVGGFSLDAAASWKNTKCKKYYDIETNGLLLPWLDKTWCNPPYSKEGGPLSTWVEKARKEQLVGVRSMLLLPADTSTKWFHLLLSYNSLMIYFLRPRVKFLFEDETKGTPKFGSVVVYFSEGIYPNHFKALGWRNRKIT